jgi:phosphoacetylglucosamine mutase
VHTAYSNGAFIEYVKKLSPSIKVECVPTGVKHLHRAARKYDVGIYFEANGHGTIVHGRRLRRQSRPTALRPLMRLANPLVGCAVADLLICEGILGTLNMGFEQWANLYLEKPSVLLKLPVMDKSRYRCNLTEERLLEPEQLQRSIDEIVHEFPGSRAFVRPSGTEHVLRVYVEAMTVQAVQSVAESLRKLLEKY